MRAVLMVVFLLAGWAIASGEADHFLPEEWRISRLLPEEWQFGPLLPEEWRISRFLPEEWEISHLFPEEWQISRLFPEDWNIFRIFRRRTRSEIHYIPSDPSGYLIVDYLDVGQADCTLIRQGDHAMLFDCGAEIPMEVRAFLRSENIQSLDMVWISHSDRDHLSAFSSISYAFPIGRVFLNGENKSTYSHDQMLERIRLATIPVTVPQPGEEYLLGGAVIQVLGPLTRDPEEENNNSLAIRISYGGTSFLFCGDAQEPEETSLVSHWKKKRLQSDVLHVNHHGSNTSSQETFLRAVRPQYAIISCGQNNEYGHPGKSALQRLKQIGAVVLRTDQDAEPDGTIKLISNGQQVYLYRQETSE